MWPYPWTHVGTPSHLGHMDRVAATMPSQAHAGAAQEAPDIGQWEGQDVPLVRPSSCNVKGGIPSSRRYLPTYLNSSQRYYNIFVHLSRHFCVILAFVDPIGIVTTPSGKEIFESQGHGSSCWTPGGSRMGWRIRSPSRRGEILLGAPQILAHFEQPK